MICTNFHDGSLGWEKPPKIKNGKTRPLLQIKASAILTLTECATKKGTFVINKNRIKLLLHNIGTQHVRFTTFIFSVPFLLSMEELTVALVSIINNFHTFETKTAVHEEKMLFFLGF